MKQDNGLLELEQAARSPLGPSSYTDESQPKPPRLADLLDEVDQVIRHYVKLPMAQLAIYFHCGGLDLYPCWTRKR